MGKKILVTGAAGQLGRLVVEHLLDTFQLPAADIAVGSRDPGKLADMAARGVETVRIDFDDSHSLAEGFAGAGRILLISTDAIGEPGKRLAQHVAAVKAASNAGAERILYTSMPSAEDNRITFGPDHHGTEQAIHDCGLPYTIFRNGWYMENLFMSLPQALAGGQWFSAAGDGVLAHAARDDIARAIAAGLASPAAESVTYTLTGSEPLDTKAIAALVSEITGKPLAVIDVSDTDLAQGMAAAGVPQALIPTFVSFDTNTREGKIAMVTNDIETLTGSKPVTLRAFLEANKAALDA